MDYLSLTNKFLLETGVADTVATLVDAYDDVAQAAHWVSSSWSAIQVSRRWPFRFAEKNISVTNGTTKYTFNAMGLVDGDLIIANSFYNASGGIEQLTYEALRKKRRAATPTTEDTSRIYAVATPVGALETYPDVDTTQSLDFDYLKAAQQLDINADVPYGLPSDYHMMIVHLAVTKYAALMGGQEGANLYAHHGPIYRKYFNDFVQVNSKDNEQDTTPARGTLVI